MGAVKILRESRQSRFQSQLRKEIQNLKPDKMKLIILSMLVMASLVASNGQVAMDEDVPQDVGTLTINDVEEALLSEDVGLDSEERGICIWKRIKGRRCRLCYGFADYENMMLADNGPEESRICFRYGRYTACC